MTYIPHHAKDHAIDGVDPIDVDLADLDYAQTAIYTPSTSGDATDLDHVAAHGTGIGTAIASYSGGSSQYLEDDTITSAVIACWELNEGGGVRASPVSERFALYEHTSVGVNQSMGYRATGVTNVPHACDFASGKTLRLAKSEAGSTTLGLTDGGDFSVCGWAEFDSTSGAQYLISEWVNSAGNYSWVFGQNAGAWIWYTSDNGTRYTTDTWGTVSTGTAYFWYWEFDSATDTIGASIDDAALRTKVMDSPQTGLYTGSARFVLGGLHAGESPIDGWIAQPFVFDRKLSAAEITHVYNSGSGRATIT